MQILERIFWLPFILIKALSDVARQKKYLRKHISPILKRFKATNDGSISETDFTKIMRYYGFGVPAVLSENVATLRGKKQSKEERYGSTCLGAITGLFDDFYDKKHLSQEKLQSFIHLPEQAKADDEQERMFLFFYNKALAHTKHKNEVIHYFEKVNENQIASLNQTNANISYHEMMETTCNKGGNSVLFYRSFLNPELSEEEGEATYHMGAMMQMANDIFDVYKDHHDGIRTLITTANQISSVRKVFTAQMKKAFQRFDGIPFPKRNIKKVSLKLLFGISRVFVALHQFEKLQLKTDGTFQPSQYKRKELICDMEKPINLIRSVYYYLTLKWNYTDY